MGLLTFDRCMLNELINAYKNFQFFSMVIISRYTHINETSLGVINF